MNSLYDSIDWALLRRQKQWLVDISVGDDNTEGLIALLDAIQDDAVDKGYPEARVFNLHTDDIS